MHVRPFSSSLVLPVSMVMIFSFLSYIPLFLFEKIVCYVIFRPPGSLSPSKITSEFGRNSPGLIAHQSASSSTPIVDEVHVSKPNSFMVPKRTRSPPSSFSNQELQRSHVTSEDIER